MSEPNGLTQVMNSAKPETTQQNYNEQPSNQGTTLFDYLYTASNKPNIRNIEFGSVEFTNAKGEVFILSDGLDYEPNTLKFRIIRRLRRFITFIRELGTNRKE